jgi:hypothetical protein
MVQMNKPMPEKKPQAGTPNKKKPGVAALLASKHPERREFGMSR